MDNSANIIIIKLYNFILVTEMIYLSLPIVCNFFKDKNSLKCYLYCSCIVNFLSQFFVIFSKTIERFEGFKVCAYNVRKLSQKYTSRDEMDNHKSL